MILHVDSDAFFLIAPEAKSIIAGYSHFPQTTKSFNNASILVESPILKNIVTSAAECETAGVFHNTQIAIPIQYILKQIGHSQSATALSMDNNTTEKFIKTKLPKRNQNRKNNSSRTDSFFNGKNQLMI